MATVETTQAFRTVGDLKAYLEKLIAEQGADVADLPVFITGESEHGVLATVCDISFIDSVKHGLFVQIDV
jgi:hypothetical protein